jgi:CMP-N-acetylneuraminic acid synthetase
VFDEKGEVQQVWCKVYTFVERKQKLLDAKLDSLLKHQGHRKAKMSMPNVDVGSFYFNKKKLHAQNECFYTTNDHPSILDQLQINVNFEHRWEYVQSMVVFHLLTHGHPMINYKDLKDLFQLLKVKSVSKKH